MRLIINEIGLPDKLSYEASGWMRVNVDWRPGLLECAVIQHARMRSLMLIASSWSCVTNMEATRAAW